MDIQKPISQELELRCNQTALTVAEFLKCGEIQEAHQFERAAQFLADEKRSVKEIEAELNPRIDAANKLHKDLTGWRTRLCAPHKENILGINRLIGDWGLKKQKEIDAANAEKKRLEEEARAASEMALEALGNGDTETADALVVAAQEAQTQRRAVEVPATKYAGVSMRETWHAEVVDETLIPREYWVLDMQKLNAVARALKDKTNIPGVNAVRDFGTQTRL